MNCVATAPRPVPHLSPLSVVLLVPLLIAAPPDASASVLPVTKVLQGEAPSGQGGGPLSVPIDVLEDDERARIREEIAANEQRLRKEGRLIEISTEAHPLFGWPLRIAPYLPDPGYHGISNFVDQNPSYPNVLLDYACGTRTYDTATGYNHQGTDFFTWPWPWRRMDRKEVEIVAAAPGQIVGRSDGNYDRSCSTSGGSWNAVYVRHSDGSVAWYGHMKNGSLTAKGIGELVVEGEYLGIIGSSGNSTGPHLHLEVYDAANHLIDPYAGTCNYLSPDTWWKTQKPYYDSAVNRVTTGSAAATSPACPNPETPNAWVTFGTGPAVFFTTYYRDQLGTQVSRYTIYRPNGTIYSQWTHSSGTPHYAASWWYWWYAIPAGEAQGTWSFTVEYESTTHERFFTIGSAPACGRVPNYPVEGPLLAVEKVASQVRLTWGASCNPADTNYVVYEGTIGSYASHVPVLCSTGGARDATFTPASGSRYFLAGPRNATREGSLGLTSAGVQRPPGTTTCVTRLALDCP